MIGSVLNTSNKVCLIFIFPIYLSLHLCVLLIFCERTAAVGTGCTMWKRHAQRAVKVSAETPAAAGKGGFERSCARL